MQGKLGKTRWDKYRTSDFEGSMGRNFVYDCFEFPNGLKVLIKDDLESDYFQVFLSIYDREKWTDDFYIPPEDYEVNVGKMKECGLIWFLGLIKDLEMAEEEPEYEPPRYVFFDKGESPYLDWW